MSMRSNSMQSRDDAYLPRDPLSRDRLQTHFRGESMTRQADAAATDVRNIIDRYTRTGQLPNARRDGAYADVTALQGDLTDRAARARETIAKVEEHVRTRNSKPAEPAPAPAAPAASPAAPAAPSTGSAQ